MARGKKPILKADPAVALQFKQEQARKEIVEITEWLKDVRIEIYQRTIKTGKLIQSYKIIGDTENMCKAAKELINLVNEQSYKISKITDKKHANAILKHYHQAHVELGPYYFHYFLLCLEWNSGIDSKTGEAKLEEKFYTPRISVLGPIAAKLQWFYHQKRHVLTLSMPQGMGKTEIGKRYMAWTIGKNSNLPNMMLSYAASIAKDKFYNGVSTIIESPEYQEMFPNVQKIYSNAETLTLDYRDDGKTDLHSESTLYCVGFDSSITGRTRARGTLYIDDVVKDTEESSSPDRMEKKASRLKSDVIKRMQGDCNLLIIGTIFANNDPINQVKTFFRENYPDRLTEISIAGGDEATGKSNFSDYYGPLAYTDEMFQQDKALMDPYDFQALIMQNGVERDGLLFEERSLKYFSELPDTEPDLIAFAADIAWGGGDYFSMPIAKLFGQDGYVVDVVHIDAPKEVTRPMVIEKIIHYCCIKGFMEANNGGHEYTDKVNSELRKRNYRCDLTTANAPTNKSKLSRILAAQSEIEGIIPDEAEESGIRLHFLSKAARAKLPDGGKMYNKYIEHLTRFNQNAKYQGKQKDDAADATASLVTNVLGGSTTTGRVTTFSRSLLF